MWFTGANTLHFNTRVVANIDPSVSRLYLTILHKCSLVSNYMVCYSLVYNPYRMRFSKYHNARNKSITQSNRIIWYLLRLSIFTSEVTHLTTIVATHLRLILLPTTFFALEGFGFLGARPVSFPLLLNLLLLLCLKPKVLHELVLVI